METTDHLIDRYLQALEDIHETICDEIEIYSKQYRIKTVAEKEIIEGLQISLALIELKIDDYKLENKLAF